MKHRTGFGVETELFDVTTTAGEMRRERRSTHSVLSRFSPVANHTFFFNQFRFICHACLNLHSIGLFLVVTLKFLIRYIIVRVHCVYLVE